MTLIVRPGFQFDTDASTYIEAVEVADAQALETATRYAINDFVIGCKQDGIWSAIKASCILSGARTLAGALVPLVGTAPTNNGFIGIGTDYVRKTGLIGNGSTKYLNSNRANNADPQNNAHLGAYVMTAGTSGNATIKTYIGAGDSTSYMQISRLNNIAGITGIAGYCRNGNGNQIGLLNSTGFAGVARSVSANFNARADKASLVISGTSVAPGSTNVTVFAENYQNSISSHTDARLAFYSIGESLNLAALDARVSALITAFGVAIP
jgi:hypothetical protein